MMQRTKSTRLDRSDALSAIAEAFKDAQQAGLPKVAQLYNSISQLIASGKMREGMKLPGERELCAALNISLGTTQKSLTLLMNDGELSRQHGRGTFVRASRRPLKELWHYRFRDKKSQSILPVYAKVIDRAIVAPEPALVAGLGADAMGYVRVSRRINIDDRFFCWSESLLLQIVATSRRREPITFQKIYVPPRRIRAGADRVAVRCGAFSGCVEHEMTS